MTDDSTTFIRNMSYNVEHAPKMNEAFSMIVARSSLVSINKNDNYRLHIHEEYELIIPYKKTYHCMLNGAKIKIQSGQFLLIQPGDTHEDYYESGEQIFFLIFKLFDVFGNAWEQGIWKFELPTVSKITDMSEDLISAQLLQIILKQKRQNFGKTMCFLKLEEALFWQMLSLVNKEYLARKFVSRIEDNLFQYNVLSYFDTCLNNKLDVSQMAKQLEMSRRALEYKFKTVFKAGPVSFYNKYRISLAIKILKNGESVQEVSEQLGFSDPFYFSTVFKKITGHPPSQINKKDYLR